MDETRLAVVPPFGDDTTTGIKRRPSTKQVDGASWRRNMSDQTDGGMNLD